MQYHGLRKSVAEEYLEVLRDLGMIKCVKEDIVWNCESETRRGNKRPTNNLKLP